jgi:hypothetical protein
MMPRRVADREEGQVALVLLLVVVTMLLFALLFAQVGSAAEQKTQTRSVADSAAVAAAHNARDNRIWLMSRVIPHSWAPAIFASVPPVPLRLSVEGCTAAQRNWQANSHRSSFSCGGDLTVASAGDGVRTRVMAPAGEVVDGPVDASGARAEARAHARVVLARCPIAPGARGAVARWLTDQTVRSFGSPSSCYNAGDAAVLRALDLKPWTAPAAIGSPGGVLTMARNAMRVEIIE